MESQLHLHEPDIIIWYPLQLIAISPSWLMSYLNPYTQLNDKILTLTYELIEAAPTPAYTQICQTSRRHSRLFLAIVATTLSKKKYIEILGIFLWFFLIRMDSYVFSSGFPPQLCISVSIYGCFVHRYDIIASNTFYIT